MAVELIIAPEVQYDFRRLIAGTKTVGMAWEKIFSAVWMPVLRQFVVCPNSM